MGILGKIIDAGKETREDIQFVNRIFRSRSRQIMPYDEHRDTEGQEFLTMLEIPLQYFSRLMGRNFWGIERYTPLKLHEEDWDNPRFLGFM